MKTQTLKPSDLRIGNLITNKYIDAETVYKVKAIKRHQINTDHGKKYIGSVVGIPLTEEWLLKLGFNIVNPNATDIEQCLYNKETAWVERIDEVFVYCIIDMEVPIEHVHRLQNIHHALTREELEIKL